jgi:hypothetical protein
MSLTAQEQEPNVAARTTIPLDIAYVQLTVLLSSGRHDRVSHTRQPNKREGFCVPDAGVEGQGWLLLIPVFLACR